MKNIQAKKKLMKMVDTWMKRGCRHEFEESDFYEEMWHTALKACPERKTSEDEFCINDWKLNDIVGDVADEFDALEEAA